eukprot:CAMPEP_0197314738 /NCGR_PEP_ID=MMETSP0891-20130614/34986_1 /TAXON_ID=44058 ORGANISM="Aureoumbra lagunensis, Strain CCMP1510" /NCGR_SAMPLE_ID=MMETSP0891 /ASSEMBLY_ACC=CAM_ASM_000534 /LENGTH=356 /DNA_ID=CAMNT_0042803323 /DNA_START=130 /DNA_END=1197 /DNA_ORIENTATION=-
MTTLDHRESLVMKRLSNVLDGYGLSVLGKSAVMTYLRHLQEDDMSRVRHWWIRELNGKGLIAPEGTPKTQSGCPEIFAGLRGKPIWVNANDQIAEDFPWIKRLEEAAPMIRSELLSLRHHEIDGFQPYRSPSGAGKRNKKSTDSGAWNVFYLDLHNFDCCENIEKCPKTVEFLNSIPRKYGHAFFSATAAQTHIIPHYGPTNKKLRCQLPLICPPNACRIRVANIDLTLQQDKAIIFDDSFLHEAWNDHQIKSRLVLVFDVWHPDLSDREIKFLSFLQNAALRKAKRQAEISLQTLEESKIGDDEESHDSNTELRSASSHHATTTTSSGKEDDYHKGNPDRHDNFFAVIQKGRQEG